MVLDGPPMEAADLVEELLIRRQETIEIYEPLPSQRLFHESPAKIRLFLGGNRSSKTTGGAIEVAWWALNRHPLLKTPKPPLRILSVAIDEDRLR